MAFVDETLDVGDGFVDIAQNAPGMTEELLPCGRQARAARRPLDQCEAEFLFEVPQYGADRRLRHMQPQRRSGETSLADDCDEAAHLA